jgi:hypothetical protein
MLARSIGYKWLSGDFVPSPSASVLPANTIDHVSAFAPEMVDRVRDYRAADCGIDVILQKTYNIAYVPPLDVSTGAQTDNETMKQRYWTVFQREAFENPSAQSSAGKVKTLAGRIRHTFLGR